mgnify:FL=1
MDNPASQGMIVSAEDTLRVECMKNATDPG